MEAPVSQRLKEPTGAAVFPHLCYSLKILLLLFIRVICSCGLCLKFGWRTPIHFSLSRVDKRAASVTLPPLLSGRKAVEAAPDKRVVAGIMGNLGALMMGAHGSLERALEYTESAIQAGLDSSMKNSEVVGGPLSYP